MCIKRPGNERSKTGRASTWSPRAARTKATSQAANISFYEPCLCTLRAEPMRYAINAYRLGHCRSNARPTFSNVSFSSSVCTSRRFALLRFASLLFSSLLPHVCSLCACVAFFNMFHSFLMFLWIRELTIEMKLHLLSVVELLLFQKSKFVHGRDSRFQHSLVLHAA